MTIPSFLRDSFERKLAQVIANARADYKDYWATIKDAVLVSCHGCGARCKAHEEDMDYALCETCFAHDMAEQIAWSVADEMSVC